MRAPKGWKIASLGDVASFPGGKRRVPSEAGERPTLTFKGLLASAELVLDDAVSEDEASSKNMTALQPGDVVGTAQGHATGWILKKVGHVGVTVDPAYSASTLQVFRPQTGVLDDRFLYHYLAWPLTYRRVTDLAGPRRSFTSKMFKAIPIPLPPVEEQRRIAAVLDAADVLRAKRREALAKLDTLTQAIFIDMFGDPTTAAGRRLPIGELGDVVTGNTPPRSDPTNYGRGLEWIKSGDVREDGSVSKAAESLSPTGRRRARVAPPGSCLVVCIAGSRDSIGRAGLLDRPVAFNQQINAIIPGPELLPGFLLQQFRVSRRLVQRESTDSMKGIVNKSTLERVEILAPALDRQRAFVDCMAAQSLVAASMNVDLVNLDHLFGSLQQRAFRGEL